MVLTVVTVVTKFFLVIYYKLLLDKNYIDIFISKKVNKMCTGSVCVDAVCVSYISSVILFTILVITTH